MVAGQELELAVPGTTSISLPHQSNRSGSKTLLDRISQQICPISQKKLMPLYEPGAQVTNPINPQGLGLPRSTSPYCMPRFQFSDAVLKQKQQDQRVSPGVKAAIIICIAVTTIVVLATVLKKGSRGLKSLQVFPKQALKPP